MGSRNATLALALTTALTTALTGVLTGALAVAPQAHSAHDATGTDDPATLLHLVTLRGAGTATSGAQATTLAARQDRVLADVAAPAPLYRWTTALNGVAVELTEDQAAQLRADERVELVEPNAVHALAGSPAPRRMSAAGRRTRGGAGVVVGVVDSGIWPESPLFADTPGLGRAPEDFRGECMTGDGWPGDACNRKLVAATWFVAGFGPDRLRATESLSARDVSGHGTQVASVAAGNARVSFSAGPSGSGTYSGVAPQARVAAYKACWTAPDPADDGCATADLVSAIDRATADGVDVLALAVSGPASFDTVERALLGAAEADVVVIGAAGDGTDRSYAAHASPWVTTVGGLAGRTRAGRVSVDGGPALVGASRGRVPLDDVPVVLGARARAAGATARDAATCRPGSLDASLVDGSVVVCWRGGTGRIDKSETVRRADGAGMVLVNRSGSGVVADVHSVPTVHLTARAGRRLVSHLRKHPDARGSIAPLGPAEARARTARWSASGDPDGAVVKPDLLAPGTGVLGAVPPSTGRRWNAFTGTSAASAHTAGVAALVRSRHPGWSAPVVRSALATATAPVRDGSSPLSQGAGRLRNASALAPGLVFDVPAGHYRRWLAGRLPSKRLNVPSILTRSHGVFVRRVTNVGPRAMYYSSSASGFTRHTVRVEPAAIRLGAGESTTFRVVISGTDDGQHRGDSGIVTWRGAQGTTVRMPVTLTR